MRKIVLFIAATAALGACGRTAAPEVRGGPVLAPVSAIRFGTIPGWSGQLPSPEHSTGPWRQVAYGSVQNPPAATYSSYGGVSASVAATNAGNKVRRVNERLPKRDIVDVLGANSKAGDSKTASVALTRSPSPPRRPVVSTPAPTARPTLTASLEPVATPETADPVELAPVEISPIVAAPAPVPLSPAPVVAALPAPSLATPSATLDTSPALPPMMAYGQAFGSGLPTRGKVPASLGLANIKSEEAAEAAVGGLERSTAGDSGAIPWSEAVALLEAGEIEGYTGVGVRDILVTLCSGRGVMTTMPDEGAIYAIAPPSIICGREAALQGQ